MQLDPSQVRTAEVKTWRGLHLLHFAGSSCSQKVRILLREKRLDWVSHPINLARDAHVTPWFLGINPRGLVPVLVHDGQVHVESNDILAYLDALPSAVPPLFPQTARERAAAQASLDLEDGLHHDLRNLTMGFIYPRFMTRKSARTLERYAQEGATDAKRELEVRWWTDFARQGIPAAAARASAAAYRAAFEQLEPTLHAQDWLIGDRLSVLDITWFISAHRLVRSGYPLQRHPALMRWYRRLLERPGFAEETRASLAERVVARLYRHYRQATRSTLQHVAA